MTRATPPERARRLAESLFPSPSAVERALLEAVLARFAGDSPRFSDILEWSLSEDAAGLDTARFSYGFPSLAREREAVMRALIGWMDGVSPAAGQAARGVLRAALHPSVEMVLGGWARGSAGAARAKLYVQWKDTAGPAALAVARSILGPAISGRTTRSDRLPLHLLGLDLGERGLVGAKLYFAERHVDAARASAAIPGLDGPLDRALFIHRLGPGVSAERFAEPSEIDVAIADTGRDLSALFALPALAPFARTRAFLDETGARFRLRPRRLSLALGGAPKLNLYYVLDETTGENPPGGG